MSSSHLPHCSLRHLFEVGFQRGERGLSLGFVDERYKCEGSAEVSTLPHDRETLRVWFDEQICGGEEGENTQEV